MSTYVQPSQQRLGDNNAIPAADGHIAYALGLSCVAAIGGFLFGFDSGVINGTVDALAEAFGTLAAATGFAVGSVLLGCAVGAFLAGSLADLIGRRPTMLLNAVVFLISAFATGAANSAGVFIAARVLGGLAIGAASVLAPMYISEVAPPRLRGRLASLQQLAIVLGLFFAFLSNDLIAHAAGSAGATFWLGAAAWRWMFWMEAVPAVALLLGVSVIPESPRFLVAAGHRDQARHIFERISGDGHDTDLLLHQVEESLKGEHRPRISDLLDARTGRLASVVWVGIDRWGRKPLLLAGSAGMIITLAVLAVVFGTADVAGAAARPVLTRSAAVTGLVAANLYIVAFGVSWGPVMWVLLGEMFPNRLRGAALAVSGATNWVANFAVTVTFLPLLKGAGLAVAYGLYAVAAAISLLFVALTVRETKGRALEEMAS
jgi:SP family sugar:H+ symporter-like MFS transporter